MFQNTFVSIVLGSRQFMTSKPALCTLCINTTHQTPGLSLTQARLLALQPSNTATDCYCCVQDRKTTDNHQCRDQPTFVHSACAAASQIHFRFPGQGYNR